MTTTRFVAPGSLALALTLAIPALATAQTAAPLPAKHHPAKTAKKPAAAPAAFVPPPADADQVAAAERVYYGVYDCEFNQTLSIVADAKYPSYVNVKHLKADYLMKPVLSSTGAVRLEDTRGEALMVQIANKSMLLNTKTGHRVVDDCVSPKQRELMAAAKAAKAAQGDVAGAESSLIGAPGSTTK